MEVFEFTSGSTPLLVSMPHSGTQVPDDIGQRFTREAQALPDTDWHIPRLYDFLQDLGASVVKARHSRYVIDLNRAPDGLPLYPGANNTELCPTSTFDDQPIYLTGQEPMRGEIEERREAYWLPYHEALAGELARLKAEHGIALLWDAHSIRSQVPRFFDGNLPDLNIGSADGQAAGESLTDILGAVARDAGHLGVTHVVDGRFKGGYITRHYGAPDKAIHAIQLELSQSTYMNEDPPYAFREDLAEKIRPVIAGLIQTMLAWAELEVD
ncbi:MAG: N-formylglutamate deformylase [Pseudomonadota bacterium]